jgi:protein O-mannosyl-transferase
MAITTRFSRRALWPLAALLVAYVVLIWPALHGPFLFDDFPNLDALSRVEVIDSARGVGIYLSEARSFPGRPLAMLSFLAQKASWPDDPFPFKLANLLVHLGNGLLVFVLSMQLGSRLRSAPSRWLPVFAGLIAIGWLVHPMQLSAVLLVVQRMTLLSSLFVLLGLVAYVHGLVSQPSSSLRRGMWMTLGMACIVPAILCKENGILLPLYAWVVDATLLRDRVQEIPPALRRLRRILLFPTIAFLAVWAITQLRQLGAPLAARDFTMAERLLTEPRVLFDYLNGIVFPRYATYSVYHDDFVVSRGLLSPISTFPVLVVLVASFAAALVWRKRWPVAAFGVLWFLAGHSLESGPISLELYFEHRNYLPLAGLVMAVGFALIGLPDGALRRAAILAASLWLAASLFATTLYSGIWTSADKLAYFWAHSHPGSLRAQGEYAEVLYRAGNTAGARAVFATAAENYPADAGVDVSLAILDCSSNALSADAVARLRGRLVTAPWSRLAYQGLETLGQLAGAGRCLPALDEEAWASLTDSVLANPNFRSDPVAMGYVHYLRHSQAVRQHDLGKALAELDATGAVDPDPEIVRLQAKYLVQAGRYDTAIALLEDYNASQIPLLRRLLVDDARINREAIAAIRLQQRRPADGNR